MEKNIEIWLSVVLYFCRNLRKLFILAEPAQARVREKGITEGECQIQKRKHLAAMFPLPLR